MKPGGASTTTNDDATPAASDETVADTVHALRNGLAGVRSAIQVVREPMGEGMEREILGEVMQRLDDMDQLLLRFAAKHAHER